MGFIFYKERLLLGASFILLFQGFVAQFPDPCSPNLANSVEYVGRSFSFPSVINSEPSQWQVGPANDPSIALMDITGFDNTVKSQFVDTYTACGSQLTIFSSTVAPQGYMPYSTAGLYLANYQKSQCSVGASLTVIQNGPQCSVSASDSNNKQLSCEVTYSSYIIQEIQPIITWINSNGTTVKTDQPQPKWLDLDNIGLLHSVSMYQIPANDAQKYQCQLTFSAPFEYKPSMIAKNAPNFTATCNI